jgi:ParB family chromosome partitioning protein
MSETTPPHRRRALGRGLGALLSSTPPPLPTSPADTESGDVLREIPIDEVAPNPEQPRRAFDEAGLADLADSIRLHGLLQPIVVEARPEGGYRLVAGERRLRAARLAGLRSVPAVVRPASESARQALELALVENLQRTDLSPIEEAAAFARLADTFGLSHDAIARRVGRSRPAVSNAIRLLGLPPSIQLAPSSPSPPSLSRKRWRGASKRRG